MTRFFSLLLIGLSLLAGRAWAGPLFDPFLERFQVGTYNNPREIDLVDGFPADLLEPVLVDTAWTRAARRVLTDAGDGPFVTWMLFPDSDDESWAMDWKSNLAVVLDDLESGLPPQTPDRDLDPLWTARASRAVFQHMKAGRYLRAAALAVVLRDQGKSRGLADREVFIWDLRAKRLIRLASNKTGPSGATWPTMLDLGSYDKGSAWALWTARCRINETSLLNAVMTTENWGRHLAGISKSWLTPAELYDSDFSSEFKAGLGAVFFKGAERDAHFLKFPDPPSDNALQGLWVRGRRLQSGGAPAVYEDLAANGLLNPGWRMDVWRRASELRLLKGQWDQGLKDLRQALVLASEGQGHWTTRRRLRQWNEQALVLALAQNNLSIAHQIHDLGREHFRDKDLEAFGEETSHWAPRLDAAASITPTSFEGIPDRARSRVERGKVADLKPVDEPRRNMFRRAAAKPLWDLWIRWGITLANPEAVQGVTRERAIIYRDLLVSLQTEIDPDLILEGALGIVAARLDDSSVFDRLLAQAFDRDVGLASGWTVPPEPSVVPDLLPQLRGSELDRHALLGFALAVGDMRGILAVAVELEGRGLTPDEKRRFLYPLPVEGAIFDAIVAAGSDPALLLAVARNESLFEPSIRSRAGALGWMQIMPFHYDQRGALSGLGNWRHPGVSIQRGDGLLLENSRRYGGNPYQAVAAYNAGPEAASRWERQLGGSPDRDIYLAWIGYPETRHYVEKVLIDREIYDWIIRAESSR